MHDVTIIDAGVGNLGNLERALRRVGASCSIRSEPREVRTSRCLLLPGVGAFRPPRENLRGALEAAIREALASGAWLLGICVGYQLLFEESEEFGSTDGLALIGGQVTELRPAPGVLVPHIGWNSVAATQPHPLFDGIDDQSSFYFVHSFAPRRVEGDDLIATTCHGVRFAAAAGRERVLGVQFHPEKSGKVGLTLLRNFLDLATQ